MNLHRVQLSRIAVGIVKTCLLSFLLSLTLLLGACNMVVSEQTDVDGMAMDQDNMEMDSDGNEGAAMDMSGGSMAAAALEPKTTEGGLFTVSAVSQLDPVVINETHSWTLHIETAAGEPVTDAEIAVEGGMPEHNHGFPTTPRVTENLGDGNYLLEGVRFNMGGGWVMTIQISSSDQSDTVTFELELK